jgi:hypothetical protein
MACCHTHKVTTAAAAAGLVSKERKPFCMSLYERALDANKSS